MKQIEVGKTYRTVDGGTMEVLKYNPDLDRGHDSDMPYRGIHTSPKGNKAKFFLTARGEPCPVVGKGVDPEELQESPSQKAVTAPMTKAILSHLERVGSITNVEAQAVYRCRALPRRIADIREAGYEVIKKTKFDPTGQRYVQYILT